MDFDYPSWLNPVIFSLGPVQLTWYALAYMVGLVAGWRIIRWRVEKDRIELRGQDIDDYLIYALVGVILGGRIGAFLFGWVETEGFWDTLRTLFWPVQTLPQGGWRLAISGMSFHGGFLGVVLVTVVFWLRKKRCFSLWRFSDYLAMVAPIGIGLGRLANFINLELNGRLAGENAPLRILYKTPGTATRDAILRADFQLQSCLGQGGDPARCTALYDLGQPRHPSQLYEALGEGLLLFIVLTVLYRLPWVRVRAGFVTGVFVAVYGTVRFFVEYVRTFTEDIGLNALDLTRAQELSLPMILVGWGLMVWAHINARNAS